MNHLLTALESSAPEYLACSDSVVGDGTNSRLAEPDVWTQSISQLLRMHPSGGISSWQAHDFIANTGMTSLSHGGSAVAAQQCSMRSNTEEQVTRMVRKLFGRTRFTPEMELLARLALEKNVESLKDPVHTLEELYEQVGQMDEVEVEQGLRQLHGDTAKRTKRVFPLFKNIGVLTERDKTYIEQVRFCAGGVM